MALNTTHSSDGKIGPIVQGVLDVNGVAAPAVVPAVVVVDTAGNPTGGTGPLANQVQGTSASGAADDGSNPVKIGGVYNATFPALASGQRGTLQAGPNGLLAVLSTAYDGTPGTDGISNISGLLTRVNTAYNGIAPVANANYAYNSATSSWDRVRADGGALRTSTVAAPATTVASSGNVANTAAAATLAGVAGKTTHITGFQITATGTTVASVVNVTVTGLNGGTLTYSFAFPVGVAVAATPLNVTFPNPIPASAANTAIVVTLPAGGSGTTNAAVNAQGFQL